MVVLRRVISHHEFSIFDAVVFLDRHFEWTVVIRVLPFFPRSILATPENTILTL